MLCFQIFALTRRITRLAYVCIHTYPLLLKRIGHPWNRSYVSPRIKTVLLFLELTTFGHRSRIPRLSFSDNLLLNLLYITIFYELIFLDREKSLPWISFLDLPYLLRSNRQWGYHSCIWRSLERKRCGGELEIGKRYEFRSWDPFIHRAFGYNYYQFSSTVLKLVLLSVHIFLLWSIARSFLINF